MTTRELIGKYAPRQDNLLLLLHECQNRNPENYITRDDMREIASYLNLTLSAVYGVVTYYSMFSDVPRGRHVVRICHSPVCKVEGADSLLESIGELLDVGPGETTDDRLFTVEHTECLGRCAASPCLTVDEETFTGVTPAKLASILSRYQDE